MRILFLLQSDIQREQRVAKEIDTLGRAGHEVVLLEVPPPGRGYVRVMGAARVASVFLWTRRLPRNLVFWPIKHAEMSLRLFLRGMRLCPDVVHCVDRFPLPAAFLLAVCLQVPLVYDTQEIWPGVRSSANCPRGLWLLLETFIARRAARVMVTDALRMGITEKLLHVESDRLFVLMSLSRIPIPKRKCRSIRSDCQWLDGKIAVYAGGLMPGRHIEEILAGVARLPEGYRSAVLGFGDNGYIDGLRQLADRLGVSERVAFLPPVPWDEVSTYIAGADCTFAFYSRNSLNNLYCSPSKLFDAIMAGVPVIGSDNPLVREILAREDFGVCLQEVTPETVATAVRRVTEMPRMPAVRERMARVARERYCWEAQEPGFLRFYSDIEAESRARGAA